MHSMHRLRSPFRSWPFEKREATSTRSRWAPVTCNPAAAIVDSVWRWVWQLPSSVSSSEIVCRKNRTCNTEQMNVAVA